MQLQVVTFALNLFLSWWPLISLFQVQVITCVITIISFCFSLLYSLITIWLTGTHTVSFAVESIVFFSLSRQCDSSHLLLLPLPFLKHLSTRMMMSWDCDRLHEIAPDRTTSRWGNLIVFSEWLIAWLAEEKEEEEVVMWWRRWSWWWHWKVTHGDAHLWVTKIGAQWFAGDSRTSFKVGFHLFA